MFNLSILKRYIFADFLKITFNVFLVFFSLGIILNLFEEINFFKDYDVGVMLPLIICFLKVPNLIFNLFPFIVLISSVWLFLKMIRTDELTAMRVAGTSNADIILMPSILAFIMGIIFVVGLNPVTSTLTQKYFSIKGNYTQNNDYLAAITVNGIWIKEKNQSKINIIRSASLQKSTLLEVSIYQFDENYNPLNRIEAESANIQNKNWVLSNVRIFQKDENVKVANFKELEYSSAYDLKSIKDLYSNLETVSFWNLKELIKLYEERGYSTKEIRTKLQRSLSFPFFLLSMVLLAGVSILGLRFRGKYIGYLFFAIISCVLIYYFNDFSKALGETGKLPIALSVWMPVLIIFVFSSIGLIHVNQK